MFDLFFNFPGGEKKSVGQSITQKMIYSFPNGDSWQRERKKELIRKKKNSLELL